MTQAKEIVAFKTPVASRNIKQGVGLACRQSAWDKMNTFYTEQKINQHFYFDLKSVSE